MIDGHDLIVSYTEKVNELKARRHYLNEEDKRCLRRMKRLIQLQAVMDDKIDRWEDEIQKLRTLERVRRKSKSQWETLRNLLS